MADAFRLDGKIALITGAASGIGAAIARVFTGAGAEVIAVDLNGDGARNLAASIPHCRAIACDITQEPQIGELFAQISKLDILVNCAGIGMVGTVEETALDEFDKLILVNVIGTFLMSKAALPLIKTAAGSILNIGSVAGLVGVKRRFAYCATKGAVIAMTRQLAVDYPTELRANCIAPGTVDSPFIEGYLEKYHKHEKEKVRAELNLRQPIGRLGKPEEIADLALYLSSPAAAFVHGSVITIDGGWTAA